ncbi:tRNA pseudouridine(38-40) synthase TruA [Youngiibacter fragilis]|uniref:tRNA pseudouridine synthase A n=1 Tax=Youngiibacter fragilis 232.1 TaxID=994573 RepID=V7I7U1_9CLOT|nr:tRNA pseudouridine(38-40) synthase TruA [Youngiibacter fragilis]ETA81077.1 tRNA pseudouridine synthase A [Youngiibacter fragilis 232.1]
MTIKLLIEYDGTAFSGWQRQPHARTVQGDLERALSDLLMEDIKVNGSSRTDSGVHAREYPVSFQTNGRIPPERIALAVNAKLPDDIRALSSVEMPEGFHARYSSDGKTYSYRMLRRNLPSAIYRNYACMVEESIDLEKMTSAAELFRGSHDFRGFMSTGSSDMNTVKEIRDISLSEEGNFIILTVTASGFLYNMARIIAGTLIDAGMGKMDEAEIARIIGSGIRGRSKPAPSCGLYLEKVYY